MRTFNRLKRISRLLPISLMCLSLGACSIGGPGINTIKPVPIGGIGGTGSYNPDNALPPVGGTDPELLLGAFACPATAATETPYSDNAFIDPNGDGNRADGLADRFFNGSLDGTKAADTVSVAKIEAEFNAARAHDPTINENLKLPAQGDWDAYSHSQKALYLVNAERCARGLRPFRGIAPELGRLRGAEAENYSGGDGLTKKYSDRLLVTSTQAASNQQATMVALSHDYDVDGNATADSRIRAAVGTENVRATGENLAAFTTSKFTTGAIGRVANFNITEAAARSVYNWMYNDKRAFAGAYRHRATILTKGYTSGLIGAEASNKSFDIAGLANGGNTLNGKQRVVATTMNVFDARASYSMGDIGMAPEMIGPGSPADCKSGSIFTTAAITGKLNTCQ